MSIYTEAKLTENQIKIEMITTTTRTRRAARSVVPYNKRRRLFATPMRTPRLPSVEWKYQDLRITSSTIPGNSTAVLINGMTTGTLPTQRIGVRICVKSVECRYNLQTAGTLGQPCRFIICSDAQANGLAWVPASFFASSSSYYNSMRNLSNRKRFKTYMDQVVDLQPLGQGGDHQYRHIYYKFKRPFITDYNTSNTGTIADITTNSLWIMFTSLTACSVDFQYRIRFTDL